MVESQEPRSQEPRRLVLATTVATYVLLLAGGLVHSTGSGLACPDWPLCYGRFLPPMVGNIRFEHGHRLIAGTVAILTAIMCAGVWRKSRPSLRPLAVLAAASIVVQIALGALTVIFLLPDLVSTAHLAVGTAFFSLLVILSVRTSAPAEEEFFEKEGMPRAAILTAALAVYVQMVLGALVRHTESGLACLTIPSCQGAWFPPLSTPAGLHMFHRFASLAVAAAVFWVYRSCLWHAKLWKWATAAMGLVIAQIGLGVLSVLTKLSLWPVMAHLAAAQALLMCLVVLAAKVGWRSRRMPVASTSAKTSAGGLWGEGEAKA